MAKKRKTRTRARKRAGKKLTRTTIVLLSAGGADPENPKLSTLEKHKIRFHNRARRGLTVTFQNWPFVEPPGPIPVTALKKSKWFAVVPDIVGGKCDYSLDPDLTVGDEAPDPPGISFDP